MYHLFCNHKNHFANGIKTKRKSLYAKWYILAYRGGCMDELTRLLNELRKLLQNIPEEDRSEILDGVDISAIQEELGPWYIPGYPLYQGS